MIKATLATTDKRKAFWSALRRFAPEVSEVARTVEEVRQGLGRLLEILVARPLDDDEATTSYFNVGVLYRESHELFGRGLR